MDAQDHARARGPPGPPTDPIQAAGVPDEVLQYAYKNDLTKDYTLNSFSITHLLSTTVRSTLPSVNEDGFTDSSHLPVLEVPTPILRSERLTTTKASQQLLDDIQRQLTDDEVKSLTQDIIDSRNTKHLKLELPLLRTDNERDMKEFRKDMEARRELHIADHGLPLDPITEEDGEGMQLPASARSEAKELLRKIENEKLGITRSALKFLADIVKDDYDEDELWNFIMKQVKENKWVRNPGLEKLEMPVSPQLSRDQFIPPNDTYLIPIPSDPSSSIFADDLKAAEEQLFEEYGEVWSEPTSPILNTYLDTEISKEDEIEFLKETYLEESKKENLDDYKIEPPILPNLPLEERSLPGPEAFGSFVAQELDMDGLAAEFLENFSGDNFEDDLANLARSAMKTVEQEQLQAADAIARVPVPIMDFSIPEPEWARLSNNGEAIFKYIQCDNDGLFSFPKWPRDSVTESKLIWRPIGSGASKASTEETIDAGETLVKSYIGSFDSDEIPSSLDFIQKPKRLAILERMTADDEIEVLVKEPKQCSKPSLEMPTKRVLEVTDSTNSKKPRSSLSYTEDNGQSLLVGDSPGASARLLSNFMELHAPKKKLCVSKYFPTAKHATPVLPAPPESSKEPQKSGQQEISAEKPPSTSTVQAPYPSFTPISTTMTIFISLTAPRYLIRSLEGLLPGIILMERDYNKHNTSVWSPGSVSRTEVVAPLAYDADLTLSPSTGVVTTSLIIVRQKPRPQSAKNGLQEKIEKIAPRYDRLLILVGGGGGLDNTFCEMATSDAAALTDLQGFVTGLECNALVYYIGGGDDTLSKWVASLVCRYGQPDPNVQCCLMEDETLWELWLRRAGFNVYAAQMVAGQLKVPKTAEGTGTSPTGEHHGLAAFVTMSRNERMRRFGPVVGPRVLERVSRLVDEIWNKP